MRKRSFKINEKASITVASILHRHQANMAPMEALRGAGFEGANNSRIEADDLTSVLLEVTDPTMADQLPIDPNKGEQIEVLASEFVSASVSPSTLGRLIEHPAIRRIQSKKESQLLLEAGCQAMGLLGNQGRMVQEDGSNVLIGVVDSGFDLSHPMFRGPSGLRVEALLDQTNGNRVYDTAGLSNGWASGGSRPGFDQSGHGTHVASIAGGSRFHDWEGVAPGARFVLVKTDLKNTDKAVRWIFDQADRLDLPCVVNMSLGHHWGSHDGTDQEERFHEAICGPGRIVVIAAGNEHDSRIHVGGRMFAEGVEEIPFSVLRQPGGLAPWVALTAWYADSDIFEVDVVTPSGQSLTVPGPLKTEQYESSMIDIELSRRPYVWSGAVEVQAVIQFRTPFVPHGELRDWRLRLRCRSATVGRIDAWFHNGGFAEFGAHDFVERQRTVGLAATGRASIAVAAYVTKTGWHSDLGAQVDDRAIVGRISPFSSRGPTRDGRWKPEISAPGQYITAALADGSQMAPWDERALGGSRVLTIEGTSMAAPFVSGTVALMLQRKPRLTPNEVRDALAKAVSRDSHTGPAHWTPEYGAGKLDVPGTLARL